ncbi:MAG TPA: M23 family metallopeptidase, partial [Blastocatellia bacterium]|nr:M23 family metallopeptidase [Blastocatellia bacterium]
LADAVLRQFSAAPAAPGAQRAVEAARLVRAEGEPAAFSPGESNPLPAVKSAASEAEPGEVEMQRPLSGRISSPFGLRRDPIHGHQRRHAGVDIAAPRGTEIKAAAPGTVVFAGRRGGYGNLVEIEHADGRRTRYAHAAELLVAAGDQVSDGQPIATVGATGRATGPHLHFEVMENGVKVNPLQALAKDGSLTRR